jgi:hypothetical protein
LSSARSAGPRGAPRARAHAGARVVPLPSACVPEPPSGIESRPSERSGLGTG